MSSGVAARGGGKGMARLGGGKRAGGQGASSRRRRPLLLRLTAFVPEGAEGQRGMGVLRQPKMGVACSCPFPPTAGLAPPPPQAGGGGGTKGGGGERGGGERTHKAPPR